MANPYNGHHCWNCWNVSLWTSNDEGLYRTALECKRVKDGRKPTGVHAAARFIAAVGGPDTKTPESRKRLRMDVRVIARAVNFCWRYKKGF